MHGFFFSTWLSVLALCSITMQPLVAAVIEFQTDRPLDQVRPLHDQVRFEFFIKGADGLPLSGTKVHVKLLAPATQLLFSTDFPLVEDSVLIDAELVADQGRLAFTFVPPIRGTYRLQADVLGDDGSQAFHQEWQPEIAENPEKIRNLTLFLLVLFGIACISGVVLGLSGKQRPPVRGLASLLLLLLLLPTGTPVEAHGDAHHAAPRLPSPAIASSGNQGEQLELKLLTDQPRVGQLTEISSTLRQASGEIIPARYQLRFIQVEHGITVFQTEVIVPQGSFHWKGQLYDGSLHRIEVVAVPLGKAGQGFAGVHAAMEVAVEGVAPPPLAIAKSFILLLGIAALAMLLGYFIGQKSQRYARFSV